MTFADILADAYDRTGHPQSPDTAVARRFKGFVNRWNRKVLTDKGMEALRRATITLASVADQATYGIALQSMRFVSESTTQQRLYEKTLAWYREQFPAPALFSGTPKWWVPMGITRIHTLPSAACELFAVSTSAADAGTIRAEVIRSNGYRASLAVGLNGLTAVSLSATITDVMDIENVYLGAAQVGDVTLLQASGAGTQLSKIPKGQTQPRFLRIALAATPASAITYTVDGIAPVVDLVNDTDEPFPNPDFHDLYVDGAVHDELLSRGRASDARDLRVEIEKRLRDLRASILEWNYMEPSDRMRRTFDETIHEPVGD
jgi:hypothetical protein